MASLLETHGSVITLDMLPIGQAHNPYHFLLRYQGQSTDYALQHGGYGIETRDNVIRGYMDYLLIKSRRGYGINGWVVRSIEEMQAISLSDGGKYADDWHFAENIAQPQLAAIRAALNYTDGALSIINSELDSWVLLVATRFHLNPDEI